MATIYRKQQTQAMQRRLARRPGASGLLGLAGQFQTQIEQLTSQYETEFSQYQQRVSEMMAPYEQAMQRYTNEQLPAYEAAVAGFDQRLSAWQQQAEIAMREPDRLGLRITEYGNDPGRFRFADLPSSFSDSTKQQSIYAPYRDAARQFGLNVQSNVFNGREIGGFITLPNDDLYYYEPTSYTQGGGSFGYIYRKQGLAPDPFTEQRPDAPALPEMPQIGEFDQAGFDQRRQDLQTGFQREVAERRSARMSANRRTNRTLLSGVQ